MKMVLIIQGSMFVFGGIFILFMGINSLEKNFGMGIFAIIFGIVAIILPILKMIKERKWLFS